MILKILLEKNTLNYLLKIAAKLCRQIYAEEEKFLSPFFPLLLSLFISLCFQIIRIVSINFNRI